MSYVMTPRRKAAILKAQAASALKRKGTGKGRKRSAKKYSSKRGSFARDVDAFNNKTSKMKSSKSRTKRAAGHVRGAMAVGNTKTAQYKISKKRGQKAGKSKASYKAGKASAKKRRMGAAKYAKSVQRKKNLKQNAKIFATTGAIGMARNRKAKKAKTGRKSKKR